MSMNILQYPSSSFVAAACMCWVLFANVAGAQDSPPVGHVKNVKGVATVTTHGRTVSAQPGTPLHQGSALKTEAHSSMGITFRDNTLMSFGPNTLLTVDEFLFEPAEGKLKLGASMGRGTLNYVSGVIAQLKPEAVSVKTPAGMIGVRGTQFLLKVAQE